MNNNRTQETAEDIIRDIAYDLDGEVRERYSGRFMYGAHCMGIVHSSATAVIEAAAARGLTGAVTDNMGLDMIVYWPHVKVEERGSS